MKIVLILLLIAALLLCGCQREQVKPMPNDPGGPSGIPVDPNGQLLYTAENQKEAEEIAALYGIQLVSYSNDLAVYYTEESPEDVIRRGTENGWPELSLNEQVNLY